MNPRSWGKNLGKAAVVSAWLLAQGDGVLAADPIDFSDHSRGAAAFVQSTMHAPIAVDSAGVYLVENSVLPDSGIDSNAEAWNPLLDMISGFRSLEDDWDGDGAAAPLPGVIAGAVSLAIHLKRSGAAAPKIVYVGVNGTICFEWRSAVGNTVAEVVSPVEASIRWFPKGESDSMAFTLTRE